MRKDRRGLDETPTSGARPKPEQRPAAARQRRRSTPPRPTSDPIEGRRRRRDEAAPELSRDAPRRSPDAALAASSERGRKNPRRGGALFATPASRRASELLRLHEVVEPCFGEAEPEVLVAPEVWRSPRRSSSSRRCCCSALAYTSIAALKAASIMSLREAEQLGAVADQRLQRRRVAGVVLGLHVDVRRATQRLRRSPCTRRDSASQALVLTKKSSCGPPSHQPG